ncbi:MAG: hypothetical protein AABY01_00975, partial [Nanoarchaeota archaeon]
MQWLENKQLVTIHVEPRELVLLDSNGRAYKTKGLPERHFLKTLSDKEITIEQVAKKSGISREELNACIGVLRAKGLILLRKDKDLVVKLTPQGTTAQSEDWPEETFLSKTFPVAVADLTKDERVILDQMKRRKQFVTIELRKDKITALTELGEKLLAAGIGESNVIESLTPDLLRSGKWRGKEFRRYDVTVQVPKISGGRKHFVNEAMDYMRKIWIELGFTEMEGSMIQTSFWNMDTLYTPQDHPARELQDTFYVKNPANGTLPALAKKIKTVHENGNG